MADYIPSKESEKIKWLLNFTTWMNGHGTSHGFTQSEVMTLYFEVMQARSAVKMNNTRHAEAKGAAAAKNQKLGAALALARALAQRIQLHPNTTDQDRADAGLTVRDHQPTKSDPNIIYTTTPPLLDLDFSIRQQVIIHWGPNPQDERHNGRPPGAIACQIQYHPGGIPTDETQWNTLEIDTESPIIHSVTDTTPTTYAYRARYVGKNLKFGPFSNPATCTVSV